MKTAEELAEALEMTVDELRCRADSDDEYKKPRKEPKSSGGLRRIDPPKKALKAIQRRALKLLAPRVTSTIAYGITGRSDFDAARVHVGQLVIGKLDILNFFSSVGTDLVRDVLRNAGFAGEALDLLVALLVRDGRLRQGPPSSPAMANLVLAELDRQVAAEMLRLGVRVTRVTDDFAISGATERAVDEMQRFIRKQVRRLGLRLNEKKTSICGDHEPQIIHSLSVKDGLSIPKNRKPEDKHLSRNDLRGKVRRVLRDGCSRHERKRLLGQLTHLERLHPRQARQLRAALAGDTRGRNA